MYLITNVTNVSSVFQIYKTPVEKQKERSIEDFVLAKDKIDKIQTEKNNSSDANSVTIKGSEDRQNIAKNDYRSLLIY